MMVMMKAVNNLNMQSLQDEHKNKQLIPNNEKY